jgi:hypothetical protein
VAWQAPAPHVAVPWSQAPVPLQSIVHGALVGQVIFTLWQAAVVEQSISQADAGGH